MKKTILLATILIITIIPIIYATDVSGTQSGTWTFDNSPYNVIGSITVPAGSSLEIEPGVQIQMLGNYRFTVQGTINAVGTEADSIRFFATGLRWDMIRLENETSASTFSHCIISNADTGVSSVISPVTISQSRFDDNITGIRVYAIGAANPPEVLITHTRIANSQQNGIFIVQNSNTTISYCEITGSALNNQARGAIQLSNQSTTGHNNPTIVHNHIHHNVWQGLTAWDITGSGNISPTVEHNLIEYNLTGVYLLHASGIFQNNIIRNNFVEGNPDSGAGVMISGASAMPTFVENIFTGNFTGFYIVNNASANLGDLINDYPGDDGMNQIYNNVGPNGNVNSVYNLSSADIMAQNNIWDSEDYDEIAETIFDGNDNIQSGIVHFDPIYAPTTATISGSVAYYGDLDLDTITLILYDPVQELEIELHTIQGPGDYLLTTSHFGELYLYAYGHSETEPGCKPFTAYDDLFEPLLIELEPGEELFDIDLILDDQLEPLYFNITGTYIEGDHEIYVLELSRFIFPAHQQIHLYEEGEYLKVWAYLIRNEETGEMDLYPVNGDAAFLKTVSLQTGDSWSYPHFDEDSGEVIYLTAEVTDFEFFAEDEEQLEKYDISLFDPVSGDRVQKWYLIEDLGIIDQYYYQDHTAKQAYTLSGYFLYDLSGWFPLEPGNIWSYFSPIPPQRPENLRQNTRYLDFLLLKWEAPRQNIAQSWEGYRLYKNWSLLATLDIMELDCLIPYPEDLAVYYITAYNSYAESAPSNLVEVGPVSADDPVTELAPVITLSLYPNPLFLKTSKSTELSFRISLPEDRDLDLAVYNIKGQRVRTIHQGLLTKGVHELSWNLQNNQNRPVSNGIYFLRLSTENDRISKKLTIIN